jgi:CARDB/PAP2 superfamily
MSSNLIQTDLVGQFSKIELPDTIEFGDRGQAQVRVINQGDIAATGSIKVKLYASTDGNIDGNDALLTSKRVSLNLSSGQSTSVNLNYNHITSAVAPGSYYLIAQIDSENQIAERRENNNVVSKLVSAPNTDVVLDWNATALNAIQAEGEAGRGVPPTFGSRLLAMVSAAVHDTVQAFQDTYTPYAIDTVAPRDASLEAAIASAARNVLIALLPNQRRFINRQYAKSLEEIQDTARSEIIGVGFGKTIAEDILELRANDGSQNNTPYQSPSGEYVWRPGTDGVAVGVNWGKVDPFAIPNVEAFAPNGLDGTPTKNGSLYAREIEEVRRLGGRSNTDITQIERTADQTEIAIFWAYDRADTFRPYGQLNQISQEIAVREGNSIEENASLFAAINIALADAAIVAWDAKYDFVQPRPDDVIAGGIAARDRFNSTVSDPNWRPLLDTPPFPDYISGHSTFGGAWAGVMAHFFGENYEFTAVSQELPGVTRSFNSFYEAAFEDAISRVYGGIHVREATVTDALPTGIEIGNYVAENLFQPTVA